MRPYLVTLRADLTNPFLPRPDLEAQDEDDEASGDGSDDDDDDKENEEYRRPAALLHAVAISRLRRNGGATGAEDAAADPQIEAEQPSADGDDDGDNESDSESGKEAASEEKDKEPPRLQIDLDGIERRIYAFPVPDGRYGSIAGIKGKALFTEFAIQGQLDGDDEWDDDEESDYGSLRVYTFKEYRGENLIDGVNWFDTIV